MTQKILVVDDEPDIRMVVKAHLTESGYRVLLAKDGADALQKAGRHLPDLILLDIMMPGIDGYQVCAALKQNELTQKIPIVFLTAKSQMMDKLKAQEKGGNSYITKPFSAEKLITTVEFLLKSFPKGIPSLPRRKVLVVDDDPDLRGTLEAHLSEHGFSVIVAENGEQVIEKVEKELPRVIVLDLTLPKLDGFQVCSMLKTHPTYRTIPIIVLTGSTKRTDRLQAWECRADDYITKPFNMRVLVTKIKLMVYAQKE